MIEVTLTKEFIELYALLKLESLAAMSALMVWLKQESVKRLSPVIRLNLLAKH